MSSCVSQPTQKLDPLIYYKRELRMDVNDHKAYGTMVIPKSDKYKIKIKFPGKGDLVTLKTCHRETEQEKLGRSEKMYFYPNKGMEDTGMCFLEIAAFEHKKGRHAWGIIDFESDLFTLPAHVKCNGNSYNSRGTTVCQSKEGLLQEIEFPEAVVGSDKALCDKLPFDKDNKKSRYKTSNRECTYIFKGKSGRFHKLTTIGYEKIIIREL